jgi:hypothetical protein
MSAPRGESPIFSRTHDLLLWLLPQASRFPRAYRFTLAERLQHRALDLQESLIGAGLSRGAERQAQLQTADVQLAQLRHLIRLCLDLRVLGVGQYAHVAALLTEIGKLLGAWQRAGRGAR